MLTQTRDTLFLLKHDFTDGTESGFYCPECAEINGVLHYYPALRHQLDIRYVDFPRPRPDVVSLIGAANQSCPVLVLAEQSVATSDSKPSEDGKHRFISGAKAIGQYLHHTYHSGQPH